MKTKLNNEQIQFLINRLAFAREDFRHFPSAYPILADYGYMERTENGFKCIDADAIYRRCGELINELHAKMESAE